MELTEEISEKAFPPCIKETLKGMRDGKKRFLFILINFLKTTGNGYQKIEEIVKEWNKSNEEQLKEGYILSQLSWHKRQTDKVLPPNCPHSSTSQNFNYYKDLRICNPDNLCMKIKNPTSYAIRKEKILKNMKSSNIYKRNKKSKDNGKNKNYSNKKSNS